MHIYIYICVCVCRSPGDQVNIRSDILVPRPNVRGMTGSLKDSCVYVAFFCPTLTWLPLMNLSYAAIVSKIHTIPELCICICISPYYGNIN